jgi:hypothetical protein
MCELNVVKVLANAPEGANEYCYYDYGECTELTYLNCKNEFYDPDERRWVKMDLVDNYFHSRHNLKDIKQLSEAQAEIERLKGEQAQLKHDVVVEAVKSLDYKIQIEVYKSKTVEFLKVLDLLDYIAQQLKTIGEGDE